MKLKSKRTYKPFKMISENRGFTLIEMMISLAIMGITTLLIIRVFETSIVVIRSSDRATSLANLKYRMEQTLKNPKALEWTANYAPPGGALLAVNKPFRDCVVADPAVCTLNVRQGFRLFQNESNILLATENNNTMATHRTGRSNCDNFAKGCLVRANSFFTPIEKTIAGTKVKFALLEVDLHYQVNQKVHTTTVSYLTKIETEQDAVDDICAGTGLDAIVRGFDRGNLICGVN